MVLATRETATQRHWTCGRRLRERRHALGLTQAELVDRLGGDPAITNRSISTWENGRGLDFGWLPELSVALDCSVTYLLGMTDDPQRWEPAPGVTVSAPAEPVPTVPDETRTPGPDESAEAGALPLDPAGVECHWILGPGLIPPDHDGPPAPAERESS
jgi:transcriptional regulator with XRE-family HTH domain